MVDLDASLRAHLPPPAGALLRCPWWGRDPGLPAPDAARLGDALEQVRTP